MTAPLRSTPRPSSTLSASQTAPVAEFRCLFTHDVRRKQKRWQDGYLKFHSFNSRVMVCDQARNHIGDTYWKESNELQEGDELSLDKGVLVEVAEAMGITQTDLAPLLKKTKEPAMEPPTRPAPSAPLRPFQRPTPVAPSNTVRAGNQLRHKSLNTLLGTPKGPTGKAMPIKSPYQSRKEKEQEEEVAEERAPKRQKVSQRPTGWRASSPAQEDAISPTKPTPLRPRTTDAKNASAAKPQGAKVITISSESDHIPFMSSDVTLPSTPARVVKSKTIPPPITSAPNAQSPVLQEPLHVQTPKIPPAKIRLPKPKPVETPKRPSRDLSPPVSASNRLMNVDFAVQPVQKPPKEPSPPPSLVRNPKAKSLRLSKGVKRATLLCQSISKPPSRAGSQVQSSRSKSIVTKTSRLPSKEPSPAASGTEGSTVRGDVSQPSRTSQPTKSKRKSVETSSEAVARKKRTPTPVFEAPEDVFDDPEIIHGLMDQQLLLPSSPIESHPPCPSPLTKAAVSKPTKAATKKTLKISNRIDPGLLEEVPAKSKPPAVKKAAKKAQPVKKTIEKPQPSRTISPPEDSMLEPPPSPSRGLPPAHTDAFGAQSRNTSTSPTKLALSTGGFRKKSKLVLNELSTETAPLDVPPPAPRNEIMLLAPPLLIGRKGPLMSTTELAALLAKPKKRTRVDDPIEDDAQDVGKSPARKIRRVRSENDAPIPSIADDWEKRNLPKPSSNLTEDETVSPPAEPKKKQSALGALVKRTDPRKKFQRTQSLGIDTNLPAVEPDLPSPVIDEDVGPWSTEAFDLFDWRPPVREEAVT